MADAFKCDDCGAYFDKKPTIEFGFTKQDCKIGWFVASSERCPKCFAVLLRSNIIPKLQDFVIRQLGD